MQAEVVEVLLYMCMGGCLFIVCLFGDTVPCYISGIYVLMFVDIFKTFWKMFLLTVLLLVAFALAFYMALDDPSPQFAVS